MGRNKYENMTERMTNGVHHQPPPPVFVPKFKSTGKMVVTYLPNGWGVAILDVTPELATEMLQRNTILQRHMKPSAINKYAWDMMEGKWLLTHQGVAFDENGDLYDGQNRLSAVITSGATVKMLVFFGVGRLGETKEMTVIDTHKTRDVKDASKIDGREMDRKLISTFNAMLRYGITNGSQLCSRMGHQIKLEQIESRRAELELVLAWVGTTRLALAIATAPILASIACAIYHVDRERLKRFVMVLTEQADPEAGEGIAKVLRQWIQSRVGMGQEENLFLKTCRAIQHFMNGVEMRPNGLLACSSNPFPPPNIPTPPM